MDTNTKTDTNTTVEANSTTEMTTTADTTNAGTTINVTMQDTTPAYTIQAKEKRVNKNIFVWVFAFLLGCFGVDRFVRGQVGLGILKILTLDCFGIWWTVDFIIALVKAYSSNHFGDEKEMLFINGKYAR